MKKLILLILFFVHNITAEKILYSLDDDTYHRFPPKYAVDRFGRCLAAPGGMYCTAWADVVADRPSTLLDTMKAYSANYQKHFNYTNIKYGVCLSKTCKQFYKGDTSREALWNTTEACLNETFAREYNLKTRVTDIDCYGHGHQFETNAVDHAILLVLALILALNVAGSVYDIWLRDQTKPGNQFLLTFSIAANWKNLVAPSDPRQARLQCLNGIKAISSMLVIVGHIPMPMINAAVNPQMFEKTYDGLGYGIVHNGHLITLTFFSTSGFLLAYTTEEMKARGKLHWTMWPKAIISRWLRLTPANVVVLMITAIWYKFVPIGPYFKEFIMWEATDCRKYWLYNVLYISNFISHSQCNLQVWFLASDMQLHIIGLGVIVLAWSKRARSLGLLTMYLVGIGYPAYLIYTMDLDGTFVCTIKEINTYFTSSATFNLIFKPVYANLPCFVIGMCFGYLVHSMQKNNQLDAGYRKYRELYWLSIVAMVIMPILGRVFYVDGLRLPMVARLLYAPIVKPMFGTLIQLIILGTICRCDDLVRSILEWHGWLPLAKISYCTYLAHMSVLRYTGGTRDSLFYLSKYHITQDLNGMVCMTLIFAAMLHLLVELPFGNLVKIAMSGPKPTKKVIESNGPDSKEEIKAD